MSDILMLKAMLDKFKMIPHTDLVQKTFMEISGYPHYENVCSNILSFFLSTDECHGMSDLLLKALFAAIGRDASNTVFGRVNVERETTTDLRQRIDLVINTDQHVIGIENKVYSGIGNDLEHYAHHIQKRAQENDRESILILLTLKPIGVTNSLPVDTFLHTTYECWFGNVKKLLGDYALTSNQGYLIYLLDFMRTLDRLGRGTSMDSSMMKFFAENEGTFSEMLQQARQMKAEFKRAIEGLAAFVEFDANAGIKQWVWSGSDFPVSPGLIHELPFFGGRQLALNALLTPAGWYIDIMTRKDGSESLEQWLADRGVKLAEKIKDNRFVYARLPHNTAPAEIGVLLSQLLRQLASVSHGK